MRINRVSRMADRIINIQPTNPLSDSTKDYIIGIKNGVAMVRYPNNPRYRADAAREGYDIITVNEAESALIWKNSVTLSLAIVDIETLNTKNS